MPRPPAGEEGLFRRKPGGRCPPRCDEAPRPRPASLSQGRPVPPELPVWPREEPDVARDRDGVRGQGRADLAQQPDGLIVLAKRKRLMALYGASGLALTVAATALDLWLRLETPYFL